ncbi:hypothetical protein IFM89_039082 [Coptis chinensis]|uniref:Uncharacterized protein n=1 Tax=Coptis chinensis TaxID=261450 RepID=A0A835I8M3_9MAGN|nr:hypothetical protein IFM89_039082 [Coptis chinensis]
MKKVGLGKVVVSLLRSDEETTANKKLAKDLQLKLAGREDGIQFRDDKHYKINGKAKMTARRKALCMEFDMCQSRKDVIRARAKLIEREHRQKMKTKLKQMKVLQKKSASRHNSQRGTSKLDVPDVVVRNLGNHFRDLNMSAVPDPVGNLGNHFGDLKMS